MILASKKIIKKFMDMNISNKIMLTYLLIFIFSSLLGSIIYQRIHYQITSREVKELSLQTLYSIQSNILSRIENINYNSKSLLSNRDLLALLKKPEAENDVSRQRKIGNYVISLFDAIPHISSIYLYDNYDNVYGIDKRSFKNITFKNIEDANWYQVAIKKNGYYILRLNAGDNNDSDHNFISFIRVINDLESLKKVGVLMINMEEDYFIDCYHDLAKTYGIDIILLDQNNSSIVKSVDKTGVIEEQIGILGDGNSYSAIDRIDGQNYIISGLEIETLGWKIISSSTYEELSEEWRMFSLATLFIILGTGCIFLLIGTMFISRIITNPIKRLNKAMKKIEDGEFSTVDVIPYNDEIGKMQYDYNIMIKEIEGLIERIKVEQKVKRKAELNVLHAQIKPHFLYNTLDAMASLALSGKTQQLYDAIEALGSYYRTCLSKGKEIITIREEIDIVKNYILLQNMRYKDICAMIYDIDPDIYDCKILKLALQPIVENALYHGIKPKGETGIITVSIHRDQNTLLFSIEDDGVGMTDEECESLVSDIKSLNKTSFGLRGTIERLSIFYGAAVSFSIKSRKASGTKVTIKVPIEEGDSY